MSKNKTTERMLGDMLTTEELMARMQPVMDVNKDELSRMLYEAGFRLTYYGDTWKWALKYV